MGFVSGFRGAIRSVLPLAPSDHRAGVLAVIDLVSYLALSLPVIIALAAPAFAGLARRGQGEARLPAPGPGEVRDARD